VKIIYVHLSRKDRLLIIPGSYLDFLDRKKLLSSAEKLLAYNA